MDWSLFIQLHKVYFFKQASDMICVELVKSTKIEKRIRESLKKVGYLLKYEKCTTIAKQVTIKELEEKIVNLSAKLDGGSQFKALISKKYNEIANLKRKLKNTKCTSTTKKWNSSSRKIERAIIIYYGKHRVKVDERDKGVNELNSHISTLQFQRYNRAQSVPVCTITKEVIWKVQIQTIW